VQSTTASSGRVATGAAFAVAAVSGAGPTAAQQPGSAGRTLVSGAQQPWSEAAVARGWQTHGPGSAPARTSNADRAATSARRLRAILVMGARFAASGQEPAGDRAWSSKPMAGAAASSGGRPLTGSPILAPVVEFGS